MMEIGDGKDSGNADRVQRGEGEGVGVGTMIHFEISVCLHLSP